MEQADCCRVERWLVFSIGFPGEKEGSAKALGVVAISEKRKTDEHIASALLSHGEQAAAFLDSA